MSRRTAQYQAVLHSPRWRQVRGVAFKRAGGCCEKCGKRARLDGHHWRGYKMLGHEQPGDIRMLCRPCHQRAHGKRPGSRITGRMIFAVGLILAVLWLLRPYG